MTEWERHVVEALAGVDRPGGKAVHDSLQYLVVTGGCGCGCSSFDVRDTRFPAQPHQLEQFFSGVSTDPSVGFGCISGLTVDRSALT